MPVVPTSQPNPAPQTSVPRGGGRGGGGALIPPAGRLSGGGVGSLPNRGGGQVGRGIERASDAIAQERQQQEARKFQKGRDRAGMEFQLAQQMRDQQFKNERAKQDSNTATIAAAAAAYSEIYTQEKNASAEIDTMFLKDRAAFANADVREFLVLSSMRKKELTRGQVELVGSAALAITTGEDPAAFLRREQSRMIAYLGADGSETIPLRDENGRIDPEALVAKMAAVSVVNIPMLASIAMAKHQATQGKGAEDAIKAAELHRQGQLSIRRTFGAMAALNPDDPATIDRSLGRHALLFAQALADPRSGFEGGDPIQFLIRTLQGSGDPSMGTAAALLTDTHDEYFTGGKRDARTYAASGGDAQRVLPVMQYISAFMLPVLESLINEDAEVATFVSIDENGDQVMHTITPGDDLRRARQIINQSALARDRIVKESSGLLVSLSVFRSTMTWDNAMVAREVAPILHSFGLASQEFSEQTGRHPGPVENIAIWKDVLGEFPDLLVIMDVLDAHFQGLAGMVDSSFANDVAAAQVEMLGPPSPEPIAPSIGQSDGLRAAQGAGGGLRTAPSAPQPRAVAPPQQQPVARPTPGGGVFSRVGGAP